MLDLEQQTDDTRPINKAIYYYNSSNMFQGSRIAKELLYHLHYFHL